MHITSRLFVSSLILLCSLTQLATAQYDDFQVTRLTSHNMTKQNVWSMSQDAEGYLYFGTTSGLHRYDGHSMFTFKTEIRNPSSLPNINIRTTYSDAKGQLWVCTQGGALSVYQPATRSFKNYFPNDSLATTQSNNVYDFWNIREGSDGMLWLSSMSGDGFYRFNPTTETFTRFAVPTSTDKHFTQVTIVMESKHGDLWVGTDESGVIRMDKNGRVKARFHSENNTLSANRVRTIFEDSKGTIWVGLLSGGLVRYNAEKQTFTKTNTLPQLPGYSFENVYVMLEDSYQNLWIGTDDGLVVYSSERKAIITHFAHQPAQVNSLFNNKVRSIYPDKSGVFWIGNEGGGAHKLARKKKFHSVLPASEQSGGLNVGVVRSFLSLDENTVWVATQGGGINVVDLTKGTVVDVIQHEAKNHHALANNEVTSFLKDYRGNIWVGTWGGGLCYYNPKTKRFTHHNYQDHNPQSLSDDRIQFTLIDSKGIFWVGTENGLNIFNNELGTFERIQHQPDDPESLSGNTIQSLAFVEDKDGVYWIGTWQGFNKFDLKTRKAKRYLYDPDNPKSISSNHITAIHDDGKGHLWISTFGGGLNRFRKSDETFEHFLEDDGSPNNLVFAIIADEQQHLWLSTSVGLSRFDPQGRQFVNFREEDGLQGNAFWWGAAYKAPDGRFFFGGTNGFTHFFPDSIQRSSYVPPVVISSFNVFDKQVLPNQHNQIHLDYSSNYFTIEYASLDFTDPQKNQYAYRLEGVDPDWIYSGNRNVVSYAALKGNHYVFHVKGTNSDGIWNETGTMLNIIIHPPFYDELWFKLFGIVFGVALIVGFYTTRTVQIRKQKETLEALVTQRTEQIEQQKDTILKKSEELEHKNQDLTQLNEEKNYLISIVAHDLRNPLSGLKGFAEYIKSNPGISQEELQEIIDIMEKSSEKGLALISKILDTQALEQRSIALHPESIDVVAVSRQLLDSLKVTAAQKFIRMDVQCSEASWFIELDRNYLLQIFENLLSNALKYSPIGAQVSIIIKRKNGELWWGVRDTGPGISPADQQKLFRKYQRLSALPTGGESSVGLGLSIVKRFTEAMNGRVWCESELGKGSTFWVAFPYQE